MVALREEELGSLPDLHGINYFVQIADSGGFSKASAVLNVPQPTLSRYIRRLEDQFGIRLFDRNGRGVLLTEAGASLYQHSKAVLARLHQAQVDISNIGNNPSGSAIVGLAPIAGKILSLPIARRFLQQLPHSRLHIVENFTGHILEWVANGRVDVGILYEDSLSSNLEGERLWDEPLVLMSGRAQGLQNLSSIAFSDLDRLPLIIPGRPHGLRLKIDEIVARLGIRLRVTLETDGLPAILDFVHKGLGCAILTPPALYGFRYSDQITLTKLSNPTVVSTVVAVTSKQRPITKTVRTLMQIVRDEARLARLSSQADVGVMWNTCGYRDRN